MSQGIRVVIYPVKDLAQAKALYSKLLGVEPYTEECEHEVLTHPVFLVQTAMKEGA